MNQIKDGKGRVIGSLKDSTDRVQAFNYRGVFHGYYHKASKRTFDKHGVLFSMTDSTVALIHSASPFN